MSDRTQHWRFFMREGRVERFAVGKCVSGSDTITPPTDGRDYFTGTVEEAAGEAIRIAGLLEAKKPHITTPWGARIKINAKAA